MASPYVHERQSEYWTSRQIEDYYLDAGFELLVFPLSQYSEKLVPTDYIFFDKHLSKLFGFQYKALYHGRKDYWPIDPDQHKQLSNFSWIYYCLSELKNAGEHRTALHKIRIISPTFPFQEKLYPSGQGRLDNYSRWGAFYDGLAACLRSLVSNRNSPQVGEKSQ